MRRALSKVLEYAPRRRARSKSPTRSSLGARPRAHTVATESPDITPHPSPGFSRAKSEGQGDRPGSVGSQEPAGQPIPCLAPRSIWCGVFCGLGTAPPMTGRLALALPFSTQAQEDSARPRSLSPRMEVSDGISYFFRRRRGWGTCAVPICHESVVWNCDGR